MGIDHVSSCDSCDHVSSCDGITCQANLQSYTVLKSHTHISVGIGRVKRTQLGILHNQHGLRAKTYCYHGDDVRMVQLTHNGNLW